MLLCRSVSPCSSRTDEACTLLLGSGHRFVPWK